jgi:hypothetical protein
MPRTWRARAALIGAGVAMSTFAQSSIVSRADVGEVHASSAGRPTTVAVGVARCAFVDRSRGVLNYGTSPSSTLSGVRTVVTEIRYPTKSLGNGPLEISGAAPLRRAGGFPTIVFAHGYDVTPGVYAPLLDAWVKAGFVVIAPVFPDENGAEVAAQHANTEGDLVNEPADIAFVTRQMLAASAVPTPRCPVAHGIIDPASLALAGHSDGATAVGALSYARGRDPQGESFQALRSGLNFQATILMSGQEDGVHQYGPVAPSPTLLVIQSAGDQCNPEHNSVALFNDISQTRKFFLLLRTAHHLPPFDGQDAPAFAVVVRTSVRFLRIALRGATLGAGFTAFGDQFPFVAKMFPADVPVPVSRVLPTVCGPN